MKVAAKVTRFVGLGFSIVALTALGLEILEEITSLIPLVFIPIGGWIALIVAVPGVILKCALMTYPMIVSIMAVVKTSKNKPTIAVGVMMITTLIFSEELFFVPVIAGVLIILSCVFSKKAKEKEMLEK